MNLTRFAVVLTASFLAVTSAASAQNSMPMGSMHMDHATGGQKLPTESGQSAFAAIHEVVTMLEADPKTDWSKVDIDDLRQHLIDMDNVTLRAKIGYQPQGNGEIVHVTGDGDVRDSIRRMVDMHVRMAGTTKDWSMKAHDTDNGVDVSIVATSPSAMQKIRALGFIGMMSDGMHHQMHHWMLATGAMSGM